MANELVQGLLQGLLQPQQGPNPADLMAAISSRNPMAAVSAMQAPQLSQMFGQQFRGLIGGITGNKPLSASEALTTASQQMAQANPQFMGTSAGLSQLARAASAVGRTTEAMQLSLMASEKKLEEEQATKQEQQRLLNERVANAQIEQSKAAASAAIANARTPAERDAAVAAAEALTAQRAAETANMPGELAARQDELRIREAEATNRMAAINAQVEATKIASQELGAATQKRMNDAAQEALTQFNAADRLTQIANNWEANPPTPGVFGSMESTWKNWIGTQGSEEETRAAYNQVMQAGIIGALPPGPATDRDIIEAKKGWPSDFSNPESLARFLRGMSKLAAISSEQASRKSEWIQQKGSLVGFVDDWREYTQSEPFASDIAAKYRVSWDSPDISMTKEQADALLNQQPPTRPRRTSRGG